MERFTITAIADRIPTEADAYVLLEELRWKGATACAHCGSNRVFFLKPTNGVSRSTRTGAPSQRRVWKCGNCRKQFSVLTNTIFHGTKISLRKWLLVVFEMCASKNGVAAREIERKYQLTPKSAWFMLHRIREAMKREPAVGLLEGRVVADETFIGGKARNRHGHKTNRQGKRGGSGGLDDKTAVLTLVSRETGEARSRVIPNVRGNTLRAAIRDQVAIPTSHLHTDSALSYVAIGREFAAHSAVDRYAGEYVRGDVSTNQAESYFAQLKRSIDGTHHHISREHLPRYLAEFDFRHTTRGVSDTARMRSLAGQFGGRRLMYSDSLADTLAG